MTGENRGAVIRERPGCVIGIALGIMVVGALVALLWLPRTEKRDGAKLLETWLGIERLPPDFEVRDAAKLMGGEEIVQLLHVGVPQERALASPPAKQSGDLPYDWSSVDLGAKDQPPHSLMFVRYPKEHATSELNRLFSEKWVAGKFEDVGNRGGRIPLERGLLTLGESNPAYVLERQFEAGGTFKDLARVDLSNIASGLILHAEWSRSEPFSKSQLQSLIESLRHP